MQDCGAHRSGLECLFLWPTPWVSIQLQGCGFLMCQKDGNSYLKSLLGGLNGRCLPPYLEVCSYRIHPCVVPSSSWVATEIQWDNACAASSRAPGLCCTHFFKDEFFRIMFCLPFKDIFSFSFVKGLKECLPNEKVLYPNNSTIGESLLSISKPWRAFQFLLLCIVCTWILALHPSEILDGSHFSPPILM